MTARLFRCDDDGRWLPVGPVVEQAAHLPDLTDRTPIRADVWQVVPRRCDACPGDRWVVNEATYRLNGRCGPSHWAWRGLVEHTARTWPDDPERGADWLANHEVWGAKRIDPSAPPWSPAC